MSKLKVDQISKATGAAPAIFTLPAADGSADQTLKTDGSGQLGWSTPPVAGTNTPAWHVGINSATQTIPDATQTIVELDDVKFNSGFTWDTSGYKGTPGTAGKYLIGCFADMPRSAQGSCYVYIFKNTDNLAWWGFDDANAVHNGPNILGGTTIVDLNATDYVQMKVYIDVNSGTAQVRQYSATICTTYMYGMKLIGA